MWAWVESFARGWLRACDEHAAELRGDAPAAEPESEDAGELAGELEENKAALADLVEAHERLQARADLFADLLREKGVRRLLLGLHPDKHPNMPDEGKRELENVTKKVNAAYDVLKGNEE